VQRVSAIGARLERDRRGRQRARRALEVAHGEGHLGLRDDTAGAGQLLVSAEAAGGAPEELAGARVLAELGHRDAAEGERRGVVTQAYALEGAERVAGDEGARGGGDQGVHRYRLLRGGWVRTPLVTPRWAQVATGVRSGGGTCSHCSAATRDARPCNHRASMLDAPLAA